MKKDMLTRFQKMKQDAQERAIRIRITDDQLSVLVLADVIEDIGIDMSRRLDEIDKSLVVINQNI